MTATRPGAYEIPSVYIALAIKRAVEKMKPRAAKPGARRNPQ